MTIKPTLHDKYVRHDGTCVIKLKIYIDHDNIKYVSTDFYCRVDQFDERKGLVKKNRPNSEFLNSELKRLVLDYERKFLSGSRDIKSLTENVKTVKSFRGFIEDYLVRLAAGKIKKKGGLPMSANTIRTFPVYTNYLFAFFNHDKEYNYSQITYEFFEDFVHFLRYDYKEGYAENTITKAVKSVQSLMTKARKLHANTEYRDFTVKWVDSEAIALDESEVKKIEEVKLPDHLAGERDRFLIAYNFLLRFTDSIKIDQGDIKEIDKKHYLNFHTQKTNKKVVIPIFKITLDLLKKYKFNLPKTTNQESNWKLKEIGRLAGIKSQVAITEQRKGKMVKTVFKKHELISTHTSRRSMATNLYLAGMDLKTIQLMGGWKTVEMLEKYLKIDKQENAIRASEHEFFKGK